MICPEFTDAHSVLKYPVNMYYLRAFIKLFIFRVRLHRFDLYVFKAHLFML